MTSQANQLYIEGEDNKLYIYVHLENFRRVNASKVLENYVEAYKNRDFDQIVVSFWSTGVPGEHLSTFRKTSNKAIAKILKGIKFIDALFHYKDNYQMISKPKLIN